MNRASRRRLAKKTHTKMEKGVNEPITVIKTKWVETKSKSNSGVLHIKFIEVHA